MKIRAGTIKRIHVNKQVIAQNRKNGTDLPALTVQTSNGPYRARRVEVVGSGVFVQSSKPLSCGARLWFETHGEVLLETA